MKILVTGGCGFIGSNFIHFLDNAETDVNIVNIDKLGIGSNVDNMKGMVHSWEFIKMDLSKSVPEVSDVDYIVNFASETHVDRSIVDPSLFYRNNLDLMFNLLECIRKKHDSIRMVHVSTDEVYGDISSGSFSEDAALKPSNPYSATKGAQDMFALSYARTYDMDISITRSANNYGSYQFPEKLIPKTIIRAMKDLPIPIYGSGNQVRDWIHVYDNVNAIYTVLKKGKKGEIYNIPGNSEIKNLELVKFILAILKKPASLIHYVNDRPGHDIRYSMAGKKIYALGWKPTITLKEGIERTVKWYTENTEWWMPLINDDVLKEVSWTK